MLLGSLSCHNDDLEQRTLKPSVHHSSLRSWTNRVIALRQISVTVLFYLEDSRRIHPQRREESGGTLGEGAWGQWGEREQERLASPFICFLLPGPPSTNWAQPVMLFYLKSSLWSSDLSLTFLCSIFAGFPFFVFWKWKWSRSVVPDSLRPHG